MIIRPIFVTFGNKAIEKEFESLKEGKFNEQEIYIFINKAIKDLKMNLSCGIKIPKSLWPKDYIKNII
jgi:hypothetical protein